MAALGRPLPPRRKAPSSSISPPFPKQPQGSSPVARRRLSRAYFGSARGYKAQVRYGFRKRPGFCQILLSIATSATQRAEAPRLSGRATAHCGPGGEFPGMRIVSVGGGPAGLYFAILMKQQDRRHEVAVFERNPAGVTEGWGVVFWDSLLDQLHASDPATGRALATAAFRWGGEQLVVGAGAPVGIPGHGYGIGRHRLLDLLVHRAASLGVEVEFEHDVRDPSELPDADLIVACDGVSSRLRERHAETFGTAVVPGRNMYIWLGTSKVFDVFTFPFVQTPAGWIWGHAYGY